MLELFAWVVAFSGGPRPDPTDRCPRCGLQYWDCPCHE